MISEGTNSTPNRAAIAPALERIMHAEPEAEQPEHRQVQAAADDRAQHAGVASEVRMASPRGRNAWKAR